MELMKEKKFGYDCMHLPLLNLENNYWLIYIL